MKRKLLFGVAALSLGLSVTAAPLTPQQALQRAAGEKGMKAVALSKKAVEPVFTERTASGEPAVYVFNNPDGGFILLGGDDAAYPVLGYSDSGTFDVNNIPDAMKWWLGEYAAQISAANASGIKGGSVMREASDSKPAVAPMVTSKWDQDAPYDRFCPEYRGSKCFTGCVATAMAQVLYYFKYPVKGTGEISYVSNTLGLPLSLDFSKKEFQWDKMLNSYVSGHYTDEEADAVAYLMQACGYSVQMNYHTSASGASGNIVGRSLRTYFGIDGNCHNVNRMIYSCTDWHNIIYDNLSKIGPVVMNGQANKGGGHSFVCDGYDGNGLYHFNWGWSGLADGFYSLEALNPVMQGSGGNIEGYNFFQNAIIGIQPPTGEPVVEIPENMIIYGNAYGEMHGNTLYVGPETFDPVGYGNPTDQDVSLYTGLMFTPVDGTPGEAVTKAGKFNNKLRIDIPVGSFYSGRSNFVMVELPELADGRYKATLMTRARGSESPWLEMECPWGYHNYVYLTVKDGEYTVENVPINKYSIENAEITTMLYSGKSVKFKANFKNDTDLELTQGVCPLLSKDGVDYMIGESILVAVPAHTTLENEWVSVFRPLDGQKDISEVTEFELSLYDPQSTLSYGEFGTVSMRPAPKRTTLVVNSFVLDDAPTTELQFGEKPSRTVYVVEDTKDIEASMEMNCSLGYADGEITVSLYELVDGEESSTPLVDQVYTTRLFIPFGETENKTFTFGFDGEAGKVYTLVASYISSDSVRRVASLTFINGLSGIETVNVDESATRYFNMQGMEVKNPEAGEMVIEVRNGKAKKVVVSR